MADSIERLAVLIEANTKSYEKAMTRIEQRSREAFSKVEKSAADAGSRVEGFMSKIGGRLAGLVSVAAAGKALSMFKGMVDSLSQIADMAERAGVSTDFIQAIGFRVQQAGGSMEDAARAAQKFGAALGDVNAAQSYLGRLFAANGQDIAKFKGDANAAFNAFADIVARAKTEQEAMNMVSEMFGERVGPKMRSTIEQIGQIGLPAFIEKMREAGHVLDNEFIKKGDDIADRWDALMNRMTKSTQWFVLDAIDYFSRLIAEAKRLWNFDREANQGDNFNMRFGDWSAPRGGGGRGNPSTNVASSVGGSRRDDLERELKQMRERIALMQTEADMIDASTYARERAMVVTKLETAAKEANAAAGKTNTEVTAEQRTKIDEMADAYARAAVALEAAKGPLRDFAREGANVNAQMQDAIVGGLKGFEDALIGIVQGTKDAKTAFRDMANAIIADILRIMIRTNITGPLAGALGSIFGGGGSTQNAGGMGYWSSPEGAGQINRTGSPQITVNVLEGAGGERTKQRQRVNNRGDTVIDVLTKATAGAIGDGTFDSAMGARFGARPMPVLRG